jgi:hypothetical protein
MVFNCGEPKNEKWMNVAACASEVLLILGFNCTCAHPCIPDGSRAHWHEHDLLEGRILFVKRDEPSATW